MKKEQSYKSKRRAFERRARAFAKKLCGTDKRFNNTVHVEHSEGSSFHVRSAFAVSDADFVAVYAEHHDMLIFCRPEVRIVQYGPRIPHSHFPSPPGKKKK